MGLYNSYSQKSMLFETKLTVFFSLIRKKSHGNEEKSKKRRKKREKNKKEKSRKRDFFFLVDPRRVELLSENPLIQLSTSVGCLFYLPSSSPTVRIGLGQPFYA